MRLADFAPKWIGPSHWVAQWPIYIGVSFACPCRKCQTPPAVPKRLVVLFWEPIDPHKRTSNFDFILPNKVEHRRSGGDDFNTLSLEPVVDFSALGHWKGHLRDGNLTGVV